MAKIINATEGKRLYELDQFHSMLSDDYLTDQKNLQTKFVYEQFFKGNALIAKERLELLNLSYSLPSLIVEKFADYVGQPVTSLDVDIDKYVSSFIWGGMAIFRPRVTNFKFFVDYVSPSEYILEDDGTERVLTYYETTDERDVTVKYVLEQRYVKNTVTRTLYKVTELFYVSEYSVLGQPVPLDAHPATAGLPEFEILPNIERSPLVRANNRIIKGTKHGTSEIRKVRSLISSIEIEAVNIQDQFLKHLQAKLAMPVSAAKTDKDGMINVRDLQVIAMEAGDTLPAYIVNSNPLIQESFTQIENFIRQICAILSIPVEFVGLKEPGGAESEGTKKIRLSTFIKKVEKIRTKIESALFELFEIKKAWSAVEKGEEFSVVWPDVFPADKKELASELDIAQNAKLISNIKAIMLYQDLTEEEALAEQEIINKENATIEADAIGV